MLHITIQDMAEGPQESGVFIDEPQQVGNADARQLAIERAVDGFLLAWILKGPALFLTPATDLDVLVDSIGNALIDGLDLRFEFFP